YCDAVVNEVLPDGCFFGGPGEERFSGLVRGGDDDAQVLSGAYAGRVVGDAVVELVVVPVAVFEPHVEVFLGGFEAVLEGVCFGLGGRGLLRFSLLWGWLRFLGLLCLRFSLDLGVLLGLGLGLLVLGGCRCFRGLLFGLRWFGFLGGGFGFDHAG